jgi:hypothetical protein
MKTKTMRLTALLTLLFALLFQTAGAATYPVAPKKLKTAPPTEILQKIAHLKPAEIEKLTGKKLTLVEKVKLKILQKRIKYGVYEEEPMTERQRKQGRWSMILGLVSIGVLFIPTVGLLAIPAAVVGLVLGIKSLKGNSNTNGMIGVIASSLTLLLIVLGLILIAALFNDWN